MARGTGVEAEISALLKGAQRGKNDGGGPLASTRRRGRGSWYDVLMSWRQGGGGRQLASLAQEGFGQVAQGRVHGERGSSVWAGCGGKKMGRTQGEQYPFLLFQIISKRLELIRSKGVLPDFKKIQIKYDF
jgi:hypothetical protein